MSGQVTLSDGEGFLAKWWEQCYFILIHTHTNSQMNMYVLFRVWLIWGWVMLKYHCCKILSSHQYLYYCVCVSMNHHIDSHLKDLNSNCSLAKLWVIIFKVKTDWFFRHMNQTVNLLMSFSVSQCLLFSLLGIWFFGPVRGQWAG